MLVLASGPLSAQIVNGSFESGAAGWTFTGGLSILGPAAFPATGTDGSSVASLGGADIPNSTLAQVFPVMPGSDYVLSLATAAGGDGFPGRTSIVRVDLLDAGTVVLASHSITNVSFGAIVGSNGFTRHTMWFRTPATASVVTLRITDTSPGGGVAVDPMIDDVRVYRRIAPNADNLIINGGFETPAVLAGNVYVPTDGLPGWQTVGASFEVWLDGGQAVEGMQHLEILAQNPLATVSQTVATIPGEDYSISFHHSPRPSVDSTLSLSITGQPLVLFEENGASLAAFQWQRFRTNFTAASSSTTISFTDHAATAAGTHIDNVTLTRLPLLATIRVSEIETCWESAPTKTYQLQFRSALTTNLWSDLGGPVQGNGATICIKDPVPAGEPQRVYRVKVVP